MAGQSFVEFAILFPVLLLLLLIAIDFGRLFFTYVQVNNAAREGAAYAALAPKDTLGITARATQETNAQPKTQEGGAVTLTISIACSDASTGTADPGCDGAAASKAGVGYHATVTVTEPFQFYTPLIGNFFGNPLTLTASTTAPVFGSLQP